MIVIDINRNEKRERTVVLFLYKFVLIAYSDFSWDVFQSLWCCVYFDNYLNVIA